MTSPDTLHPTHEQHPQHRQHRHHRSPPACAPGLASGGAARRFFGAVAAAALGLTLTAATARAEVWIDVQPSSADDFQQWDRESVAATGDNRPTVTWRVGSARAYTLKRGTVDCAAVSVRVESATYLDVQAGPGGYSGSTVDPAAATRTWQGRVSPLTDSERAQGQEFPAAGDRTARMIEAVCVGRAGAAPDRHAGALALQARLGCAAPGAAGSSFCGSDAGTLARLGLLDLRLQQAAAACHLDNRQVDRLTAALQASPGSCRTSPTTAACGPAPVDAALASLGADLARAAAGSPCAQVSQTLADATDAAAVRLAREHFQACVSRAIPRLDDRVSQADVVASGVFGACRGELPAAVAQGPYLARGLLPELTAAVLAHRGSSGRVGLPTTPKRSQAE